MPKLIPLEREKSSEEIACCGDDNSKHYVYGAELDFYDDMVDKLSLRDSEVGQEVTVIAKGFVNSVSERKSERVGDDVDETITVSIQLTELQVVPVSTGDAVAEVLKTLYPEGA